MLVVKEFQSQFLDCLLFNQALPDRALSWLPSVVTIPAHWASPAPVTKSTCTGPSITLPATKAFGYAIQVSQDEAYTTLKSQAIFFRLNVILVARLELIYSEKLMFGFVASGHGCKFDLIWGAFGLLCQQDQDLGCQLQLKSLEIWPISMTTWRGCQARVALLAVKHRPGNYQMLFLVLLIILLFCPASMKDLLVYDTCITRCELWQCKYLKGFLRSVSTPLSQID